MIVVNELGGGLAIVKNLEELNARRLPEYPTPTVQRLDRQGATELIRVDGGVIDSILRLGRPY